MNTTKLGICLMVVLSVNAFCQKDKVTTLKNIKELPTNLTGGKTLQLEALEIRAKIHEPTLIYLLDKPNFHVPFHDDVIKLSPHIPDPILRNHFE